MGQVSVEVNGRTYLVGCEDGQEPRLAELAAEVDTQVRQVARDVGALGETRLILMGALLMADDLAEVKAQLEAVRSQLAHVRAEKGRVELAAVAALEAAAMRIERLSIE